MIKNLHLTRSLATAALAIFMLAPGLGWGQVVLYENFNYATPSYIGGNGAAGTSSNNWTTHSVTTGQTTTIDINDNSLSYTGLASSTGNKVYLFSNANATSRDVNRALTSTATVLYYSALINVIDNTQLSSGIPDYFMHFGQTAGTSITIFGGRLGIKSVNTGANYRLSILNTSGGTTPPFTEFLQDLVFGTTYLVVVKYDRSTNPTTAYLWVNPISLGGTEPTGSVTNTSGTGTFSTFASICLRNGAGTPKAYIDEIRVGPTWADVTPLPPPTSSTWLGAVSNDWFDANNWGSLPAGGVPGSTTNVFINQLSVQPYPTINAAASCANITMQSGTSLLDNGFLTINGTSTVERYINGGEWHLISSPVSGAVSGIFTGKYLQTHTESTNAYTDITAITDPLTPMKGYALFDASGFSAQFTGGTLNTGAKSYSTSYSGAGLGWNLVGNPYPSAIDWNAATGWTKTSVNATTYIHVNAATWATWNGSVGAGGGTQYIAPCQGFFVEASANGSLGMNNSVRVHNNVSFFKNSQGVVTNMVRLQASGNGYMDDAVVWFVPEATAEFDGQYDAHKLFGDVPEAPQIYTLGSTELAINVLPETNTVPVGIHVGVNGTYTIAATEINDLNYVTLEDTKTGIFTELAVSPYTFNFIAGENEQRFKLHFSALSVEDKESSDANIYSFNQTVYINLKDQVKGDIFIYNLAGQLVTSKLSASGTTEINLPVTGNYMVRVITKGNTVVRKVWIQ